MIFREKPKFIRGVIPDSIQKQSNDIELRFGEKHVIVVEFQNIEPVE